jgi:signal transduction histidine kinase
MTDMDARLDSARGRAPSRTSIETAEWRGVLSHLSHELCRRMVSLRAGFDLLQGEAPASPAGQKHGHLPTMVALCDDLLELTRSYLDYAALAKGARPLHLGSYTLGALIGEADRQFAPIAAARGIAWDCRVEGPDAVVETDASRCQQLWVNLVTNALKYTPDGGRVRVCARSEGPRWCVTVADTGTGIPPEALGRVFEPFYHLARDERSGAEGNGLGLAICRELVEQMGGEIAIAAELPRGTRVTVRLPVAYPRGRTADRCDA